MKILFTSIVGRPNTGKSSLINSLIDYDLNIVSARPQATRNDITAIYNDEDYQIIFTDTPGIHKPQSDFGEVLNNVALRSLDDIDLAIFMSPANEEIGAGDEFILKHLANVKNKMAVISKIDLENSRDILQVKADQLRNTWGFENIFAVSIKDNTSVKQLLDEIKKYAYDGEQQYQDDLITTTSERFLVQEYIREAAGELLSQELPHSILAEVTEFNEDYDAEERSATINATIYVKKESQKGIVIGANGELIKKIGINSRRLIKDRLGINNKLFLKVKVKKNWINDAEFIKKIGY